MSARSVTRKLARRRKPSHVNRYSTVYVGEAHWQDNEPFFRVAALTQKKAEHEVDKAIREAARDAYNNDEFSSKSEALDQLYHSGVHSFRLGDFAKDRELKEAITDLESSGVWYAGGY